MAYDTTKDKNLNNKSNITQPTNTNPAPSATEGKKAPIVSSNSPEINSSSVPTATNDVSAVITLRKVKYQKT